MKVSIISHTGIYSYLILHTRTDVSVSVPSMRIISEGDGTVEVCATLSAGAGVTTDIPIDISLDSSDGEIT